jgi:arylsulfatase
VHPPEKAHPDFDQTNPARMGLYADLIAEMDHRVGQIVDCVEQAGIAGNTIIVFSSDNANAQIPAVAFGGSNGPWRGDFFTPPSEVSMRVPAMVRWPGSVPAGVVTEQMLSAHDWYKTFAALAGALGKVPADRPLDGIDASPFLLGNSEQTGREDLIFFGADGLPMSVKWNNIKIWLRYSEGVDKPIVEPQFPLMYDLGSDPGEQHGLFADRMDQLWEFGIALKAIDEYEKSVAQYPNIKPGQEFTGYPAKPPAAGQ